MGKRIENGILILDGKDADESLANTPCSYCGQTNPHIPELCPECRRLGIFSKIGSELK